MRCGARCGLGNLDEKAVSGRFCRRSTPRGGLALSRGTAVVLAHKLRSSGCGPLEVKLSRALFVSILVLAGPALALTDGWDVTEEVVEREWNSARLVWARQVHPDKPAYSVIAGIDAPPREMWCIDSTWAVDCDAWETHMDVWLHHYLDIPYGDPLPSNLPSYPKECSSSCGF